MNTESSTLSGPESTAPAATQPARSRGRTRWIVWTALFCMLLGAGYLLSQRPAAAPAGSKKKGAGGPIPISVATVKQGHIGVYVNALGTVTPVYTATITSRVAGQLLEVHYREGQMVHKGDLLAVIDAKPYEAVYLQAEGQLERDMAMLNNAKIDLNRYGMAVEQHAIPEQTLATQQATVNQDEGTVKVDQGTLQAARVNLDYARITAPIDGRVGLRQVDPGNIIQANGTTPLLTITQLQPITVIFTMAEDYIFDVSTQLRTGHKLRVDALDRDAQTDLAQGTLLTLDNTIDTTTGTVRVRANFPNRDMKLFPNEFVNARLLVKTLNNVNLISTAAVQRNNDVAFVYVVDQTSNTVHSRQIDVTTTEGNTAAVTGVRPGETLVIDGFDKLQDGGKVSIHQPRGSAPAPPNTEENDNEPTANRTNTQMDPAAQPGAANTHINRSQRNPQTPAQPHSGHGK